jgi:hypothetical protein
MMIGLAPDSKMRLDRNYQQKIGPYHRPKLYRSTVRAADARAVLAHALEGFSPTPEFPDIAEVQELLATL